jgi:hypothetical protein
VRTTTTAYFLPDYQAGGSLAIVPASAENADSLEFAHFKGKLSKHLRDVGYTVVDDPSIARYLAELQHTIDDGTDRKVSVTVVNNTDGGAAFEDLDVGTVTVFNRSIELRILDTSEGAQSTAMPVLELIGHSKGHCRNLTAIVDEMFQAMFAEFPGVNGEVRWQSVKADCRDAIRY